METMYQRSRVQEESLYHESLKHTGEYPIIGVNTSLSIGIVLYHLQRKDAAKKGLLRQHVRRTLEDMLACVELVPLDANHFLLSAGSTFGDLEDGAQYWAAASAGPLDAVVSRDPDYDGHIGVKRISAKQAVRMVKRKR